MLSKAGAPWSEGLAEFGYPFKGIEARPMTIGSFVIAEDIHEGVFEHLKEPVSLGKELIGARAGAALEIAIIDYEGDLGAVDRCDQVHELRLLLRVVGHTAEDGELNPADG